MALTNIVDFTLELKANGKVIIDSSGWDSITVQAVNPIGLDVSSTNDGGGILGDIEPNTITATNYVDTQGLSVIDQSYSSTINTTGIFKFTSFGKYFRLGKGAASADKLIVKFDKIM